MSSSAGRRSTIFPKAALPALAAALFATLAWTSSAQAAFTAGSSTLATGSTPLAVAIADLDGDGRADLASADAGDNALTLQLKDATGGGYTLGPPLTADGFPVALAVGDLNGDGRRDIAIANIATDKITILLKDASGDGYASSTVDLPAGSSPSSLTIADLDGDGRRDIAVASGGSDSVTVLLQDAAGGYDQSTVSLASGTNPAALAVGDLNGDGRPDIAVADSSDASVTVLTKDASGGGYTASLAGSTGGLPTSIAVGDLDGDGRLDIVTADAQSNSVTLLTQNASGGGYSASSLATGARPQSVALGDLDGDGRLDIATANASASTVTVLIRDASGGGYDASSLSTGTSTFPQSVAIGDLDGDGSLDLATANSNANTLTLLTNTTPQASKVTLTASPTSSQFGQRVTFNAAVGRASTPAGGAPTPTGTVTYTVDGRRLAPTPVAGDATAKLATSALGVGSHTIRADYSGDANYAVSSTTLTYVVGAATTITGNRSGSLVVTGRTYIVDARITGSVTVASGASLDIESSTVGGSLAATSAGALRVCASSIGGSASIGNSAGLVVVGDVADSQCPVNSIGGSLSLQSNTHGVRVIGNHVGGSVGAGGNSGPGPFPGDPTSITGNGP